MSTISSQLLVSSSSLTEDVYRAYSNKEIEQSTLVKIGRVGVFAVALVATLLALDKSNSILSLVSNAWAGFGAAFGPLVLFSLCWSKTTYQGALAGIIVGAATVLFWIFAPVLSDGSTLSSVMYEIVPGFIASSIAIVAVSKFSQAPSTQVRETFYATEQKLEQLS